MATSNKKYGDILEFNDKYADYLANTTCHEFNYLVGAYRSSKSVFNCLAFATHIDICKDDLHLVCASTVASAKTIVEDGNGLGLRYIFGGKYRPGKYKGNDAGYITTSNGIKVVVYVGGAMANSYIAFRGWSIGSVLIEEGDLLHENTINELQGRTLAAIDPKYFISHNPCSHKKPIWIWLEQLQGNSPDKVNFMRVSIYDNPALSEQRISDIVRRYDPNSIFFKRFIMGDDCAAEGVIYNLQPENIIDKFNPAQIVDYIIVIDPGKTKSATGMLCVARNIITKSIDIISELHHRNADNMTRIYSSTDYARLAIGFIKDCIQSLNKLPAGVIIDSFKGDDFYEVLRKEIISNRIQTILKFPVRSDGKDGKDKKEDMITRELDLFFRRKIRIVKDCRFLIDDLQNATYDQKALEKGIETRTENFNAEGHADMLDCMDYAVSYYGPYLNTRW